MRREGPRDRESTVKGTRERRPWGNLKVSATWTQRSIPSPEMPRDAPRGEEMYYY